MSANVEGLKKELEDVENKGLAFVLERNSFYRDRFRAQVRYGAALTALSIILTSIIGWMVTHPAEPKYFATTRNGEIIELVPLSRPNKTNDAVNQWAADISRKAYSFDFVHWKSQLGDLSQFFTENGYKQFLSALKTSGNVEAVRAKRLVGAAIANPPVITAEGIVNGVYMWKIEVPLQVSYTSAEETINQSLLISMTVERTNTIKNEHGLAVDQFITLTR